MYSCPTVIYANWESVLWRQAVVDIDDFDSGLIADMSTPCSLAVQATKHPSASMEIQMHREGTEAFW